MASLKGVKRKVEPNIVREESSSHDNESVDDEELAIQKSVKRLKRSISRFVK